MKGNRTHGKKVRAKIQEWTKDAEIKEAEGNINMIAWMQGFYQRITRKCASYHHLCFFWLIRCHQSDCFN